MAKALKLLLLLLIAMPVYGQIQAAATSTAPSILYTIAHDADGGPASNACGNSATCTWTHTVGSADHRLLLVTFALNGSFAGASITSVTCTSGTMTLAGSAGAAFDQVRAFAYYYPGPAAGSQSITITLSGAPGTTQFNAGSVSFTGVSQGSPFDATTLTTTATAVTTVSQSITTVTPNAWVVDIVSMSGTAGVLVRNSPQVSSWIVNTAFFNEASTSYVGPQGTPGIVPDGYSNGGVSSDWAMVTMAIKPG